MDFCTSYPCISFLGDCIFYIDSLHLTLAFMGQMLNCSLAFTMEEITEQFPGTFSGGSLPELLNVVLYLLLFLDARADFPL